MPDFPTRRVAILFTVLLFSLVQTDTQAGPNAEQEGKKENSKNLKTHRVVPQPFHIEVELKGTFESTQMVPVSLWPKKWSSFIVKKAVSHGSRVQKGDPLVWFETEELDLAIQDATRELEIADLALDEKKLDIEQSEATIALDLHSSEKAKSLADEALLDYMKVDRQQSERNAHRSLDYSRFQLEYAQEELDQLRKMYEADDLTEETEEIILKRAEREVDTSKFYLESTKIRTGRELERDIPRTEDRLVDAAKRMEEKWRQTKRLLPLKLELKRLRFRKQRVARDRLQEKLAKLKEDRAIMVIKAPMDGTVYYGRCVRGKWSDKSSSDAKLKPGGKVTAKQTFMTIVALKPLKVRVDLPEAQLANVRKGKKGKAQPTGFPELSVPVTVQQVSLIPIGTNTFDCELVVKKTADLDLVRPGMTCKVMVTVYKRRDAITVPPEAIHQDKGSDQSFVYIVKKNKKPIRRNVTIGKRNSKAIEIRKGLKADMDVLLGKPKS